MRAFLLITTVLRLFCYPPHYFLLLMPSTPQIALGKLCTSLPFCGYNQVTSFQFQATPWSPAQQNLQHVYFILTNKRWERAAHQQNIGRNGQEMLRQEPWPRKYFKFLGKVGQPENYVERHLFNTNAIQGIHTFHQLIIFQLDSSITISVTICQSNFH